jgi:hypothetical protein
MPRSWFEVDWAEAPDDEAALSDTSRELVPRTALELRPVEGSEWFLLTPGERDALALMRMMNAVLS